MKLRDNPWLPDDAVGFLERYLLPNHRVLELGGGASTACFAFRGCEVTLFENDPECVNAIMAALGTRGSNVNFIGEENVNAYYKFPPFSFDLVLIDGKVDRAASLCACIDLVKPGGVLMADNWDWFERDPAMVVKIENLLRLWNFTVARQRQPDAEGFRYADGEPPYLWAAAWWTRPHRE